ncbi:ALP1-like protein [Tanacetum coccineum]
MVNQNGNENEDDPLFSEAFRMKRSSFSYLVSLLNNSCLQSLSVPPTTAVAAAVFRLAHGAPFNAVGRRFDLDTPTACRVFYVVCKAIIDNLSHLFELRSDLERISVGFGWMSLPNCCGVLGVEYFSVKGNLFGENGSVMVQALVDSECRFLDVSAGWPSTTKPELVLRQSELFSSVEETRELLNGATYQLNDGTDIPQYILGDSCFPLLPWLITPYKKPLLDSDDGGGEGDEGGMKEAFNSVHSRGMELVDTAFGRLRARWKILSKEWKEESIESFPYVVVACCLLHNFLIKSNEEFPDEDSEYMRNHDLSEYEGEGDETGEKIRSAIAADLCRSKAEKSASKEARHFALKRFDSKEARRVRQAIKSVEKRPRSARLFVITAMGRLLTSISADKEVLEAVLLLPGTIGDEKLPIE